MRSQEERCRIVEESFRPGAMVASVARTYGVRLGQICEWRRAYIEGRLGGDSEKSTLLPARLSDVSPPPRLTPTNSLVSIELAHARIDIHGAADPVTLGIVLECLAP